MMEQVEAGRVEAIIVKDMSNLGCGYQKVGQIMEILRAKGVWLILVSGDAAMFPSFILQKTASKP